MYKSFLFGFLLVLFSSSIYTNQNPEIQHLLSFIAISQCTFERNGTSYTSPEAEEHIHTKYDYIKSKVSSTEDFIEYAASESSMSGSQYYVTCDGVRQSSASWLSKELSQYRAGEGQ